jgi:hypothetical protein
VARSAGDWRRPSRWRLWQRWSPTSVRAPSPAWPRSWPTTWSSHGALGVLAGIVGLSLLVLMAFTLVLIPVSLLGLLLGGATVALGWLAYGVVCRRFLVRWLRLRWEPATTAFWGTLLFMLALEGIGALPVVGGAVALVLSAGGVGAALLTRWGVRPYVPGSDAEVEADPT